MRSTQHFEVRNRIDAQHRVITIAVARPAEPTWPARARATFIIAGAAALWVAIGTTVFSLI